MAAGCCAATRLRCARGPAADHQQTGSAPAQTHRRGARQAAPHGLMENRQALLVDACLTQADGHAERVAALHMIEPRADRPTAITLGADKAYDAEDFVNELRSMNVTPSRRTPAAVALRSTGERPDTAAIASASGSASGSRRHSAGSRRSPGKRRPASVDVIASDGLYLRCRRLQSGAAAQADRGGRLMAKVPRLRQGLCRPLAHRRNGQLGQ